MADLENIARASFFGMISASSGYLTLYCLLEYANIKATVLRTLTQTSELTEQVYAQANEVARNLSIGHVVTGSFSAAVAGLTSALAIYYACRKREENGKG